ncbi:MAG: DciA family protein [Chromatiales bacterium]|nr:DciA family protein [Chromatiales bacterium]MDX9767205.1 DciA family protein [Ectothiorhodospiraceae bacterium]
MKSVPPRPKPVRSLLDPALVERARRADGLTRELRAWLPPVLGPHVWVSGCEGDTLSLLADGAAWASQLRYMQTELVKQFRDRHPGLRRVQIRVVAPRGRQAERPPQPYRLPAGAGPSLDAAARTVSDPVLARALARLAGKAGIKR